MRSTIATYPLDKFPDEAAIIGRMIIAYADFQSKYIRFVTVATGGDTDSAVRLLFKTRSETARLETFDKLVRPIALSMGIEALHENSFKKMVVCKNLRNQYAHCQWDTDDTVLSWISFEEAAQTDSGPIIMEKHHVPLKLLQKQEAFFVNTEHTFVHYRNEIRARLDPNHTNDIAPPPTMHPPRYYAQKHPYSPRRLAKAERLRKLGASKT
jgi:hypothetical protein